MWWWTSVPPDRLGRATSLGTTWCPGWKKAVTSGPRRRSRCCTGCGANKVQRSVPSRRSRPCWASARYAPIKRIISDRTNLCVSSADKNDLFLWSTHPSWWTSSGSSAWRWAPTHADPSTARMWLCSWRLLSPPDRFPRSPLRWPFHSFRSDDVERVLCLFFIADLRLRLFFCPSQNFHKQFKEMAAVMETVWWLQGHLGACGCYSRVYMQLEARLATKPSSLTLFFIFRLYYFLWIF